MLIHEHDAFVEIAGFTFYAIAAQLISSIE